MGCSQSIPVAPSTPHPEKKISNPPQDLVPADPLPANHSPSNATPSNATPHDFVDQPLCIPGGPGPLSGPTTFILKKQILHDIVNALQGGDMVAHFCGQAKEHWKHTSDKHYDITDSSGQVAYRLHGPGHAMLAHMFLETPCGTILAMLKHERIHLVGVDTYHIFTYSPRYPGQTSTAKDKEGRLMFLFADITLLLNANTTPAERAAENAEPYQPVAKYRVVTFRGENDYRQLFRGPLDLFVTRRGGYRDVVAQKDLHLEAFAEYDKSNNNQQRSMMQLDGDKDSKDYTVRIAAGGDPCGLLLLAVAMEHMRHHYIERTLWLNEQQRQQDMQILF